MVRRNELIPIENTITEYEDKFKTISVFLSELANILLPDKLSSKF